MDRSVESLVVPFGRLAIAFWQDDAIGKFSIMDDGSPSGSSSHPWQLHQALRALAFFDLLEVTEGKGRNFPSVDAQNNRPIRPSIF